MCKLLIMSGMDPKRKKLNAQFITRMGVEMSGSNRDGLGYAAVDKNGNLFGERWWYNWQAFDNREKMSKPKARDHEIVKPLKEELKDFVDLEDEPNYPAHEKYNSFGTVTDEMVAITMHTRFATSDKVFKNTHPFVDMEASTSIVHNGGIRNHCKEDEIRSTCDSERILNIYLKHEIGKVPADVQNMIDDLKGSFAVGAFSLDKDNKRILDVWRTTSSLSCAYIKELGCLVISTSLDDIKTVVQDLNWTIISKSGSIKENTFQRFDAVTGKAILTEKYRDTTYIHHSSYNEQHEMYDYDGYYGGSQRGGGNNLGNGLGPNNHVNNRAAFEERRRLALEAAGKKAASETSTALGTPPVIDWVKLTEDERSLVRELRKANFSDEDIAEDLKRKRDAKGDSTSDAATVAEAIAQVTNATVTEIDKAKTIIRSTKEAADKLNEGEAMLDGYEHVDGLWLKKNPKLN